MSPLGEFVFRADGAAYVVTARAGERRAGCLVGFGCQVSIEPERFLVAISQVNNTHAVAVASDILAVHLIPAAAGDLAHLFGETTGDDVDELTDAVTSTDPVACPLSTARPGYWSVASSTGSHSETTPRMCWSRSAPPSPTRRARCTPSHRPGTCDLVYPVG